jgi:hypothetical protein
MSARGAPAAVVALRLVVVILIAVTIGLAYHRFHRTPEQVELTRYIESEVPALLSVEAPIHERLDRLARPQTGAAEARALLVDDLIPRALKLRRLAASVDGRTRAVRDLNQEYLEATSQLIDALRACVRIIDDPTLTGPAAALLLRERFGDVRRAYEVWEDHVRRTCAQHRLVPPPAPRS